MCFTLLWYSWLYAKSSSGIVRMLCTPWRIPWQASRGPQEEVPKLGLRSGRSTATVTALMTSRARAGGSSSRMSYSCAAWPWRGSASVGQSSHRVADNRRPAAAAPTSGWLMSGSQAAAPHSASHRQNPKWEKPISPVSPRHGVILLYRPRTIQTVCVHSNLSFRRVKTFVDVHSTPTCYFRHQQLSIPRYRYYTPVRVRLSQDSSSQD